MKITVHEFTTPHKENFTVEFQPTEAQQRRAVDLMHDWSYQVYETQISIFDDQDSIVRELLSRTHLPGFDQLGDKIYYAVLRLRDPSAVVSWKPTPIMVIWFGSIADRYFKNYAMVTMSSSPPECMQAVQTLGSLRPRWLLLAKWFS